MGQPIQSRTRVLIRQDIGDNLNVMTLITASSTEDTSSLISTLGLAKGGKDEYNGRQVLCVTPTGSIVAGEWSWINDFEIADATVTPVFTATITDGDIFEMWRVFTFQEIDRAINQAIAYATGRGALQIKTLNSLYTASKEYEYDTLSGFVGLYSVEYAYSAAVRKVLHNCDTVWDELVDGDVTATRDTTLFKEGSASLKLVVAAGAGAGDILATEDIDPTDISQSDQVEVWIYSTVALDAGDLQVLLDDTAQCASPVESLDIPATEANKFTRHIIDLANPQSDSAIISVGIKMIVDKGAFSVYVDDVVAVLSASIVYKELPPEMWSIAKGSTNKLKLTPNGLGLIGNAKQLRITGYRIPALLTADSGVSEVDPDWVVARVTGRLLIAHAKSPRLDIKDKTNLSRYWLGEADTRMPDLITQIRPNIRWCS